MDACGEIDRGKFRVSTLRMNDHQWIPARLVVDRKFQGSDAAHQSVPPFHEEAVITHLIREQ